MICLPPPPPHAFLKPSSGFTLAEILIALSLLGVIAAFTIPKILNSAQSTKNLVLAKETYATFSSLWYEYQLTNGRAPNIPEWRAYLDEKLNYVSKNTTWGYSYPEYLLPNGVIVVQTWDPTTWGGPPGSIGMDIDVNGKLPPNGYCPNTPPSYTYGTDDPDIQVRFLTSRCTSGDLGDYLHIWFLSNGRSGSGVELAGYNEYTLMDHF